MAFSSFGPFFKVTCTRDDVAEPGDAAVVGILEARTLRPARETDSLPVC